MAYSRFYSNGRTKFITKTNNQVQSVEAPAQNVITNTIDSLYGSSIKTNVQNVSIKILKNSQIVAHFDLKEISSYDLNGSSIIIHSADNKPVTLLFVSDAEAIIGDQRIGVAINGGIVS